VKYLALTLVLVAGATQAQSDGVWEPTRPTPAAYASPRLPAHFVLEAGACNPADAPLTWLDASDPLIFAGSSLAQLTNDDAAFLRLRGLVELRVTLASLRLFVLGAAPTNWARLQFAPEMGRWRVSNC
jgi:hypothetical protein